MASSLFGRSNPRSASPLTAQTRNNGNQVLQQLRDLSAMIKGSGKPDMIVSLLAQKNPQFAQFVQANRGKSPQQIAQENGVDWSLIDQVIR